MHPTVKNRGFTLIELLVVIAIIGILATIGMPAIRGMSKSNTMAAANRQMLDDLAYARQRAISGHTSVYVLFLGCPATFPASGSPTTMLPSPQAPSLAQEVLHLSTNQFNTYALLTMRTVGDQPGQSTPRYLTDWRTLPNGVFIATNKFNSLVPGNSTLADLIRAFPVSSSGVFPFPNATNGFASPPMAYIGFDYLGRLITYPDQVAGRDEYIPLARGSIFYTFNGGAPVPDPAENPPLNTVYKPVGGLNTENFSYTNSAFNQLHIDWLTGRARVEKAEIQ